MRSRVCGVDLEYPGRLTIRFVGQPDFRSTAGKIRDQAGGDRKPIAPLQTVRVERLRHRRMKAAPAPKPKPSLRVGLREADLGVLLSGEPAQTVVSGRVRSCSSSRAILARSEGTPPTGTRLSKTTIVERWATALIGNKPANDTEAVTTTNSARPGLLVECVGIGRPTTSSEIR